MSISSLGNTNHVDPYCQWPIAYMPETHCIHPTWKVHICTAQISIWRFIRFTVQLFVQTQVPMYLHECVSFAYNRRTYLIFWQVDLADDSKYRVFYMRNQMSHSCFKSTADAAIEQAPRLSATLRRRGGDTKKTNSKCAISSSLFHQNHETTNK